MIDKENVNTVYYNQIDSIYINFQNNLEDFKSIINLIYNVYYKGDSFNTVYNTIKTSLKNMLTLLIKKQGFYFQQEEEQFNVNNIQSYINLIITLIKYNFDTQFKDYVISIIQQNNPDILYYEEPFICNEIYIRNWFYSKNIDLEADIINIKGTLVPNFIKLNKIYNLINLDFEFYHLLYKIYKPVIENNFSFYEAGKYNITEKDIVFDCGANMGIFAAYAASKGAKVYCFEPMSYIRNYLVEVQKIYPKNIIIIPCALGPNSCEEQFNQSLNPGECGILNNQTNILYTEKVKVISLDNFIEENNIAPTFIKMDIEGGELIALSGCINFLKQNKIVLSISLDHSQDDKIKISNFINGLNLNYNIYYFTKGENINSLFMLCK